MRTEGALDRGDADGASRRGTRPGVLKETSGGCSPRAGDRHASTVASCGCGASRRPSGNGRAARAHRPSRVGSRGAQPDQAERGDEAGGSHPLTYLCDALVLRSPDHLIGPGAYAVLKPADLGERAAGFHCTPAAVVVARFVVEEPAATTGIAAALEARQGCPRPVARELTRRCA